MTDKMTQHSRQITITSQLLSMKSENPTFCSDRLYLLLAGVDENDSKEHNDRPKVITNNLPCMILLLWLHNKISIIMTKMSNNND